MNTGIGDVYVVIEYGEYSEDGTEVIAVCPTREAALAVVAERAADPVALSRHDVEQWRVGGDWVHLERYARGGRFHKVSNPNCGGEQ